MTRKEARTFLNGTKVYVEGKSNEIQEKLFSIGYTWGDKGKVVQYEEKPFLFINEDLLITYSDDVVYFKKESTERELSADKILSIEVTEMYRPFKNQEECWQEMLKHQQFGWIYSKNESCYYCIISVDEDRIELSPRMQSHSEEPPKECYLENDYCLFDIALEPFEYTFADGIPFGVKEE